MDLAFRYSRVGVLALLLGLLICWGQRKLQSNNGLGMTEFYIVSEVTSDASPFWYHYILQVTQDGRDSVVRYVRIAPATQCVPRQSL